MATASLCGCGTYVPEIQDFGGRVEGQQLVQAILANITCELRDAVAGLHQEYPQGTFLDSWGIQTTLTLTIDEKGAIAPSVLWTPPSPASAIFSLASGLNFSTGATRKDAINAYFLVSDLEQAQCSPASRPNGAFLLQSDLKLSEWLFDAVGAQLTKTVDFKATTLAVKTNVLQHEVKFEIVTSGTANPSWKLTRVVANPAGNLFSAGRTRTHDLLITLGPAEKSVVTEFNQNGRKRVAIAVAPSSQAAQLHFSSEISQGIGTAVRNALQP
ncbi:MAG: hypothetical protein WA418_19255 [Bradyrhizobium sp.]